MALEQMELSGALFVNDKKVNEKHPDRRGSATIGGVEYWISGWIKAGKDGKKNWMSLAFTPKSAASAPDPNAPITDDQW